MRGVTLGSVLLMLSLAGCNDDPVIVVVDDDPAPPRALQASYYGGVVTVTWELAAAWDGEAFRVYSRRVTDADYFFIAEVTSCSAGLCAYTDTNVATGETYEYYVAAVSDSGVETATVNSVDVFVPEPTPAPVPNAVSVVSLDNANYLTWGDDARGVPDFSHYRVYLFEDDGSEFFLGETDSEGFLDLLAGNGLTYQYFVTSMDVDGHESEASLLAQGTPRPDFHDEVLYDHFDDPSSSGFRFQESDRDFPVVSGNSIDRHFRLETDAAGWWLVPGPDAEVFPVGFETTDLKCGVAADAECSDVQEAPSSGYVMSDVQLLPQTTYVMRVVGDDGLTHFGAVRVELLGFDQDDNALMIFDWAYQLQAGNPELVAPAG